MNGDGLIRFGRNGLLDLDGPEAGTDGIRFASPPSAGLRLIGADDEGRFVYADARVRPKGAREGRLGDDQLSGDAGDKRAERFFFDTALDITWGSDQIARLGAKDRLVTTTPLFDENGDGRIEIDAEGTVRLSGNGFFDAAHTDAQPDSGPFGEVEIRTLSGAAATSLLLVATTIANGSTYCHYGLSGSSAPTAGFGFPGADVEFGRTIWPMLD